MNWVLALDWWSEASIDLDGTAIMRMWVNVVVIAGELISGLNTGCGASGNGWPGVDNLLSGLECRSIVWMWVDVVVVTGELISGFNAGGLASGDGWPLRASLNLSLIAWVARLVSWVGE